MAHKECKNSDEVQAFLDANGGIAVVDCFATYAKSYFRWCGPCKAIAPFVQQKCQSSGIPLVTVDVDQSDQLSSAYKVQAMPTFLVIKSKWNNIVETVVGGGQANVEKAFATAASSK